MVRLNISGVAEMKQLSKALSRDDNEKIQISLAIPTRIIEQ